MGSRAGGLGVAAVLTTALFAACFASSSSAAPPELFRFPASSEPGAAAGQLRNPSAIGADPQSGDVYVLDKDNARVSEFSSEGTFVRAWGWGVVASGPDDNPKNERQEVSLSATGGSFRLIFKNPLHDGGSIEQQTGPIPFDASAAAVQAALEALESPAPGDIAVSGPAGGPWELEFVGKYVDADAAPLRLNAAGLAGTGTVETLRDGANFEICEAAAGDVCREGSFAAAAPGELEEGPATSLTVDGQGNVYVLEVHLEEGLERSARVQKFSPTGEFLLMFGGEVDKTTHANICTKADLEAGDVCGSGVPGEGPGQITSAQEGNRIAAGPGGRIYVGDGNRIEEFESDGSFKGQIAVSGTVANLAVDSAGNAYVDFAVQEPFHETTDDVFKFTAAGDPATPSSFPVEEPRSIVVDTAGNLYVAREMRGHISGTVLEFDSGGAKLIPSAEEEAEGEFFAQRGEFHLNGLATLLCAGGESPGALYVSDGSGHLSAYGSSPGCGAPTEPDVTDRYVSSVAAESATVAARINPRGFATTYFVEYGTEACGTGACAQQPAAPGVSLGGEGNVAVLREVQLEGLAPETTYHYRVVAVGNGETVPSEEGTFTTRRPGAGGLPDERAYERVSPANKNSGEAAGKGGTSVSLLQASLDGNAMAYTASTAFAEPQGSPGGNNYLAHRTSEGWSTRNVTPPTQNGGLEAPLHGFSPDLSQYLISVEQPPLCCNATPGVANYYLVDSADGALRLVTDAAPTLPSEGGEAYCLSLGGFSSDFSRLFFRANGALTAEAPAGWGDLYEWSVLGGLRLVSVLPDGMPAPPEERTDFGLSESPCTGPPHGLERRHAVSADGSRAIWTYGGVYEGAPQPLFARIDGSETVQLDLPQGVAGPGGEGFFRAASADGSKVLFSDPQPLTPGAQAGVASQNGVPSGAGDLYRYDFDAAPGQRLTDITPSAAPAEILGLLGAADSGDAAYFVATGVLSENDGAARDPKTAQPERAEAGQPNLYLWRQGEGVSFIARLGAGEIRDWDPRPEGRVAEVTRDGEHALFVSEEPITGYDNTDASGEARLQEVFLYDAEADRLTCVSCNPTGARPLGGAELTRWKTLFQPPRVLSEDGGRVFFESFDALSEDDENEGRDVYEFERPGEGTCAAASPSYDPASEGCLALISSGAREAGESYFLDASTSGDDVFISTADRLVGGDRDELFDVYDARVRGGFPEPPPPSPGCKGGACRGPATAPPQGSAPATGIFVGPADKPSLHCPRGKVARKGHCLRRRHGKRRHHRHHRHHHHGHHRGNR